MERDRSWERLNYVIHAKRKTLPLIGAALATLLAAGCDVAGSTAAAGSAPNIQSTATMLGSATAASPRLSVRLVLSAPTMASGASVTARIVIDNKTGRAIPVLDCSREMFQVRLESPSYRQGPDWAQCATPDSIPPGLSSREVQAWARVGACAAQQAATAGLVPCGPGGKLPALPPGTYQAHVFTVTSQLPAVADVTIRVLTPR